jgi:phage I-like protein
VAGVTAICDRELPGGGVPEWVHLLPAGRFTARDGRRFELSEPEAVIAEFEQTGIDLPVDYGHQSESAADTRSGPAPAAGWIKELKAKADGLWGRVEWTARARAPIGRREYRFLGPVFLHERRNGRVIRLKGAGLVHTPALHLTALARQEDDMDEDDFMDRLAEALGLAHGTDPEALLAEVVRLKTEGDDPDPRRVVPVSAGQELLKDRAETRPAMSESRAAEKVESAIRRGIITPGMRDWAKALCLRDEGSFDAFVASTPAPFAHLTEQAVPAGPPPREGGAVQSDAEAAICAQLGLKPGALSE